MALTQSYQMFTGLEAIKQAIYANYSNANNWQGIAHLLETLTTDEAYAIAESLPNVQLVTNSAGEVVNAVYWSETAAATAAETAAATAAATVNSNAAGLLAQTAPLATVQNATIETGRVVALSNGATKVATASAVPAALSHAATWLVGAGIGLKLGVWIDGALYNANPDFWDSHNMSEINPARWRETALGEKLVSYSGYDEFMGLVDEDGNMYVDQDAFALVTQYMAAQGMFEQYAENADLSDTTPLIYPNSMVMPVAFSTALEGTTGVNHFEILNNQSEVATMKMNVQTGGGVSHQLMAVSENYFEIKEGQVTRGASNYTHNDITYYYLEYSTQWGDFPSIPANNYTYPGVFWPWDFAYVIFNGQRYPVGLPGTHIYDDTPQGITPSMTPEQVLDLLRQQYPDLFNDALKTTSINPDGTTTDHYYLPIENPTAGEDGRPETDPTKKGDPDPDNPTQVEHIVKTITPTQPDIDTPTEPGTGGGKTPVVPLPTGSADALYSIYNPTNAEVKAFGAWLWSSNFVDQILKLFSDPMQAIITLHKIYAAPHVSGRGHIKAGYLDSGVEANLVDQQYITVDCGTVNIMETRGSVLDYDPFTDLRLYLPFCGIVPISTADAMRGKIGVKYKIDVITGTCIACVEIARDNGQGGVIYQFSGSMNEEYPLSSGSYAGIVTGMLAIAGGIAGTIATGGAAAPALLGAGAAIGSAHTKIEHSNSFSGNAGALACKKPYFIISRQQSAMTNGQPKNIGYPAHYYIKLSSCKGYTKVKSLHISAPGATDTELNEIEQILKSGVII